MQNSLTENIRLAPRSEDGIYEVCWLEDGRKRRRTTKTRNKTAAKNARIQIEADIRKPSVPDAPAVGWLIDIYLETKKTS